MPRPLAPLVAAQIAALAARIGRRADAGKVVQLKPETARWLRDVLETRAEGGAGAYEATAFEFRVEEWSPDGVRLYDCLAGSSSFAAALAAYRAIVRELPHRHLTLRHGAMVIEEHAPVSGPSPLTSL